MHDTKHEVAQYLQATMLVLREESRYYLPGVYVINVIKCQILAIPQLQYFNLISRPKLGVGQLYF